MLQLKDYQQHSLDTPSAYLRRTAQQGAHVPFVLLTERPYRHVPHMQGLDGLPVRLPIL